MADKTWSECKAELSRLGCNTDDSMVLTVMTYEVKPLIYISIVIGADEQVEIAIMKPLINFLRRLQDDKKDATNNTRNGVKSEKETDQTDPRS